MQTRILEIIDQGLENQECLSILEWIVKTYPGPTMMGHERLELTVDKIPRVATPQVVADLESEYLQKMAEDYDNWMSNAMKLELEDWCRDKEPDHDEDGETVTFR